MNPMIVRDEQDKEVGGAKIHGLVVGGADEHVEKPKQQRKRGPRIVFDVTRVRSEDVPAKLIYTIVEAAFIVDNRSRKSILKAAGITFSQFKHWLTKRHILPFRNELELLRQLPDMYSYIDKKQSKEFDEISKTCADKGPSRNDVLTKYFDLQESSGRVRGVGGFFIPTAYFHIAKNSKKRSEEIEKLSQENEKFRLRVLELKNIHISTQSTLKSTHGSWSRPRLEYDIQCKKNLEKEKMNVTTKVVKEEVNVDVVILNDQHEDARKVCNEKEVVCESNINMPLPLKTILKFVEKGNGQRFRDSLPTTILVVWYLHSQDHVSNYIVIDPSLYLLDTTSKKLEFAICAVD
ncbi:putative serine/threonine-protein kinase nek2 [Cucumis melo var. makuwa]|uniref:Serine/threonine-protein kinase nek2 n=1 Tax=Cucumis melo var. makuwa TaxID=1194695 RepID=A0A5A7VP79_CUCMM|nr:putative serine/threonine-protein kinase nek2 [Cucumis melo var. makuwa]